MVAEDYTGRVVGCSALFPRLIQIGMHAFSGAYNYPSVQLWDKVGSRKMGEVLFFGLLRSRKYRLKGETPEDYAGLKEMFSD